MPIKGVIPRNPHNEHGISPDERTRGPYGADLHYSKLAPAEITFSESRTTHHTGSEETSPRFLLTSYNRTYFRNT
jgi:hypothetical protein